MAEHVGSQLIDGPSPPAVPLDSSGAATRPAPTPQLAAGARDSEADGDTDAGDGSDVGNDGDDDDDVADDDDEDDDGDADDDEDDDEDDDGDGGEDGAGDDNGGCDSTTPPRTPGLEAYIAMVRITCKQTPSEWPQRCH